MKENELNNQHLTSLGTEELDFIFTNIWSKQIEGVAMASPLGPSLGNELLAHHERNCLDSCPLDNRSLYYWRFVDDIVVLFKSSNYLKRFRSYLNSCLVNMSCSKETECQCYSRTG